MKQGYNGDLDTNFNFACNLADYEHTHEELINLLKTGNIPEKQIAALKFDFIKDQNDVNALLSNLTGCDGKIREAVALRINYFLNNFPETNMLFAKNSANTFADATIDINANICRLIVDSAALLKEFKDFSVPYTDKIIHFSNEALNELDKFIFRDKKYVINKQIFKLYWCLEAINIFYNYTDFNTLENILTKCASQKEYTIREKAAQIINTSKLFPKLEKQLKQDENYYVRQTLNHPSLF